MPITQLDRLKQYIRLNYRSQAEFASKLKLTRQGLIYIMNSAKSNDGKLSVNFLIKLEHFGIDIFKGESGEPDKPDIATEPSLNRLEQVLQKTIDAQSKYIEVLEEKLRLLTEGKANDRVASA